jgi:hypothetical protein
LDLRRRLQDPVFAVDVRRRSPLPFFSSCTLVIRQNDCNIFCVCLNFRITQGWLLLHKISCLVDSRVCYWSVTHPC